MNIKIKAENKDQKRLIHRMILKSVKEGWGKIEAYNKEEEYYSGCSIQVVDIWADIEWTKKIARLEKEKEGDNEKETN